MYYASWQTKLNTDSQNDKDKQMKRLIFTTIFFLGLIINLTAQTPHGVVQVDKGRKSLWESPESMMIALAVLVGVIAARVISRRIIRMRDESSKDKESK